MKGSEGSRNARSGCDDTISRQAALKIVAKHIGIDGDRACLIDVGKTYGEIYALPSAEPEPTFEQIKEYCYRRCMTIITNELYYHLTTAYSAQPEIVRCKDCIYYDPPHVENNGVRYEYDEMPADAFDALGTGLVNAEYGINIGGRCCVDYYCKNYSDDKRVFVREDNYCGRAERRTDEQTKD